LTPGFDPGAKHDEAVLSPLINMNTNRNPEHPNNPMNHGSDIKEWIYRNA
jgi:hypothetical protein